MEYGIICLLPPIIAIALALKTKQTLPSLFIAVWVGATIIKGWNPIAGFTAIISEYMIPSIASEYNAGLLVLVTMAGGFAYMLKITGAAEAFAKLVTKSINTQKKGQVITALSAFIFCYTEPCLILGTIMRPITDRVRVSRAKLSYMLDSLGCNLASFSPISSYGPFISGLIATELAAAGLKGNEWGLYIKMFPFNIYSLFAMIAVFLVAIFGLNIGPMYEEEKRCAETGEPLPEGLTPLVPEKDVELPENVDVTVVKVADTRYAMAFISAAWFGHPAEKLKVIGITGTKGKTTTTYLVKSILENAGYKVGLVGTIEVIIGDEHIHANNTTPESYLLQEYFARMVEAGLDTVVMEVSSQALMLHRTQGFVFDYGIFTNLEPDHIGPNEHASFEEYLHCKGLLFKQCKVGIVNGDDEHWQAVTEGHTCTLENFGMGEHCMLRAEERKLVHKPGELGVTFHVAGLMDFDVEVPMPGKFSVYNALAAIAICRHFKVDEENIKKALLQAKVKGRIEMIKVSDQFTLLIDYAHNAMALESLLTTLREYEPHRLISLFGCGGNRSRQRRFEMGEVSGKLADLTIITSDNPRFEEPQDIIDDIKTGMAKTDGNYVEICDRKEAITYAIEHGEPGDIIVLAGKGHEDYQEIRGVKHPMDERDLIRDILAEGHIPGSAAK